jgi:hypothetical protein
LFGDPLGRTARCHTYAIGKCAFELALVAVHAQPWLTE